MSENNTALMVASASREISDNDIVFVGIGMPMLASLLAKNMHAPNIRMIYEGGNIGSVPKTMPIHVGDLNLVPGSVCVGGFDMSMGSYLQRGKVNIGFLGGAQIDKYGNLNTTLIGQFDKPKVRLPGSGGGNPIGSLAKKTIIIMRFGPNRFVEKLDYLTTPGHLQGYNTREAAGLPPGGPVCVISDYGIFRFEPESKEMYLDKIMPGADLEYIISMVGWELKVSKELSVIEPMTQQESEMLYTLDSNGVYL